MSDDHDPITPDDLSCPHCASPNIRVIEVGPMLGRVEQVLLIVCLECDAVFGIPGAEG